MSSSPALQPVAIDVTRVRLRVSASVIGTALALLDDRERVSAATRAGDARRRYVVADAAARVLLGERLGVEPNRLAIAAEPNGRPLVAGVAFSLSHSGEQAAVAIGPADLRIGVDIERVAVRRHLDRLAQRLFATDEYDDWRALSPRDRPRAFAARWTEVEALLKARGTGISGGLASAREVPPGWSRDAIDAGSGYVGAIAVAAPAISVRMHDFRVGDALTPRGGTAH